MKCQVYNKLVKGECFDLINSEEKVTKCYLNKSLKILDYKERSERKQKKDRQIEKEVLTVLFENLGLDKRQLVFHPIIKKEDKTYNPDAFDKRTNYFWEITEIIGKNYDKKEKMFFDRRKHPIFNLVNQKGIEKTDVIKQISDSIKQKFGIYKNFNLPINLVIFLIADPFPMYDNCDAKQIVEKSKNGNMPFLKELFKYNFDLKIFSNVYFVLKAQIDNNHYYDTTLIFKNSKN